MSRSPAEIAFVGGRLIDGNGGPPIEDSVVVLRGAAIMAAGPAVSNPIAPTTRRIDVTGKTVMPGLMDMHIHLKMGLDDTWKVKAMKVPVDLDMPLTLIGIKGFARARQALEMGFTTLRDVGDIGHLAVSLRDAIDTGLVEGPRIVACGENFSATGGTTDFLPDWLSRNDVPKRIIDGPDEIRRYIRSLAKNRVDWVKFIATGTLGPTAVAQEYSDDEIAAIVREARARGKPVCAHACYAEGALAVAKAGVDSLEHGCRLTDEIVEVMLEKGTFLVPTLSLFHSIVADGHELGIPTATIEMAREQLDAHVKSFALALEAGVEIASGSDIGSPGCAHGRSAHELTLLVEFGMTPLQAITAATKTSARMLGRDDLGTLAEGKLADLVIVDGDPLTEIAILEDAARIELVMKNGEICFDRRPEPRDPRGGGAVVPATRITAP